MDANSDLEVQTPREKALTGNSNGSVIANSRCLHKREEPRETANQELDTIVDLERSIKIVVPTAIKSGLNNEKPSEAGTECGLRDIYSLLLSSIPVHLLLTLVQLVIAHLLDYSSTLLTEDLLKKKARMFSRNVVHQSVNPAKVLKFQCLRKAGNNFAMKSLMVPNSSLRPLLSQALQKCLSP